MPVIMEKMQTTPRISPRGVIMVQKGLESQGLKPGLKMYI